jgi:hypothetical protein
MAIVGDTGNGATITLATTGGTYAITNIAISEITVDFQDTSTLSSADFEEKLANALKTNPEVTVDFIWDTSSTTIPDPGSAAETVTVTWPLRAGETTAANLAGTGQVSALKYPDFANGQLQTGQFKVMYNGDTGPTYTEGS